ncbi:MAG TPA: Ig-like domain-containing protein [Gemmatimonadales bacterium]
MAGAAACGSDLLLPEPPGGGDNVALSKVGGDGQTGTVGEALPAPLVVEVRTSRDEPAPGRMVAFEFTTEAGVVTPNTAVTNDAGQAVARWELGTQPGAHTVTARMADVEGESPVAEFTAEARPASPDTLRAQSSVSQPGRRGSAVGTPPVVRVVDRFGNPVADVPVAWTVLTGQGTVSEPITPTGADGTSTVTWTLGSRIGVHKLTAAVGGAGGKPVTGSPVTFTVTVLF